MSVRALLPALLALVSVCAFAKTEPDSARVSSPLTAGPAGDPANPASEDVVDEGALARKLLGPKDDGERAELRRRMAGTSAVDPPDVVTDNLGLIVEWTEEQKRKVGEARAAIAQAKANIAAVRDGAQRALGTLPRGITQQIGDATVTLAITQGRLTPTSAEVDLGVEVLPGGAAEAEALLFQAVGVPFSREGGFAGSVTLALLADWPLMLAEGKALAVLRATDISGGVPEDGRGTYVTVTCSEVEAVSIGGTLLLSRDWVVPVIGGEVDTVAGSARRVRADIDFDLGEDGFFVATAIATPFAFPNRPQLQFTVGTVVVDYSSTKNAASMVLPEGYRSPHRRGRSGLQPSWEGVYVSGVRVAIDTTLRSKGRPFAARAEGLLIDETGITVDVFGENVLRYGEKRVGNWDFSVDTFGLRVMHSTFEAATISGKLGVPLLAKKRNGCQRDTTRTREEDAFLYSGLMGRDGFRLGLEFRDTYCVPAWRAEALVVHPGSEVVLGRDGDGLYASALLHGEVNISKRPAGGAGGTAFDAEAIAFEGFFVGTRSPYVLVGSWGFPGSVDATLGPIALSFSEIALRSHAIGDEIRTSLDFAVGLDADGALRLTATGYLSLDASTDVGAGRAAWAFEGLRIRAFAIEASTERFSVLGKLAWYGQEREDEQWGKGFYGVVDFKLFAVSGDVGFGAAAQFGTKAGRRYFFVDMMATLEGAKIPIGPGLYLYAAGGGVYRNMTTAGARISLAGGRSNSYEAIEARYPTNTDGSVPAFVGTSITGRRFTVSDDDSFGAFVQVVITGQGEETVSIMGALSFEITPGIATRIAIESAVTFMSPPVLGPGLAFDEGLMAYAVIEYIKDERGARFAATCDMFVNVNDGRLAGNSATAGAGRASAVDNAYIDSDKRAGRLEVYADGDDWYFYLGRPEEDERISVRARPVDLTLSAYLCVGTRVPPLPALPHDVREIAGLVNRSTAMTGTGDGSGFAFGAAIAIDVGGQPRDKWRYAVWGGAGFDVNVRKYPRGHCRSRPGDFGIEQWYAAGQAYAGLSVRVEKFACPRWGLPCRKRKRRWRTRVSLATALILQLEGPNPIWGGGTLAGHIEILSFELPFRVTAEFGQRC